MVLEAGRVEQRHRLLPARVVVYYVLAMALFADASYEEVMRALVEGLSWASGWRQVWEVPAKGSIFKARSRLGREPLRLLFEAVVGPLATEATRGAFYRQWRLMSLDGTCLDVADTPANESEFGRPGTGRGQGVGAFPQLRLVALSETGTHAICAAAMGPLSSSENELADALLGDLQPGMLCLADRGFYSFQRWQNAGKTGARLLWRVKANMVLPREEQLSDGSYLTRIYANQPDQRAQRDGEQVRVVEYQLDDGLTVLRLSSFPKFAVLLRHLVACATML